MISMAEGSSWLRTRIRGEVGVDDLDLDPDLEGQEDHDPRDPGLGQGPREGTRIPNPDPDQGPNLGIGQGPKERDPSQGPDLSQETKVAQSPDPDQDPRKDQSLDQTLTKGPDQGPPKEKGQGLSLLRGKDLGQDQSLLRETSLDPDLDLDL